MTKEENSAAWITWLLDAIHKIKYQKQRPNVERVAACIRQHHPQYNNETVYQRLEDAVREGNIKRFENKGNISYKDPETCKGRVNALKLGPDLDLTKVFVRGVRELGEVDGSSIRAVEKFVRSSYEVEEQDVDLSELLRLAAKKAVMRGLVTHLAENNYYRAVIGRKGSHKTPKTPKDKKEKKKKLKDSPQSLEPSPNKTILIEP